jgi:hypothetical protein
VSLDSLSIISLTHEVTKAWCRRRAGFYSLMTSMRAVNSIFNRFLRDVFVKTGMPNKNAMHTFSQ